MDLYDQAEEARLSCRYVDAARFYQEALDLGIRTAEAHLGLGHVLRMQGEFLESLDHYQAAMERPADEVFRLDALLGKALALRALCRHAEAIRYLKEALDIFDRTDDEEGMAYALWALGGAKRISGKFTEALEHLEEALAMYRALGDSHGEMFCHCGLGGLSRILGRIDASDESYSAAHELARHHEDRFAISYSHCGLGNVHRMRGEFSKAMEQFQKAEEGYRILGDRVSYAYTVWSMGTVHKLQGEKEQAETRFHACLSLFESTRDPRGKIYALTGLAEMGIGPENLEICSSYAREYALPWEGLLVELTTARIQGSTLPGLEDRLKTFGTLWKPGSGPLNIP